MLAILLLFFLGSAIFLIIKKDQILQQTLAVVNQSLTTPVQVEKIDFSIISNWPNASITLLDVNTELQPGFKNNLISAAEIGLSVDLFSIMTDVYNINEISIRDARINLEVNPQKRANYRIFKRPEPDSTQTKKQISIKRISLVNSIVTFEDYTDRQPLLTSIKARSISAKTNFTTNDVTFIPVGSITLQHFKKGSLILPVNQSYQVDGTIDYHYENKMLTITQCHLENDLFEIKKIFGSIRLKDSFVKLSAQSNRLDY
ncbi:MAG: hypothetical protein WBA74_04170, partial [Cyclobacteriaceae bacterium]